MNIQQQLHQLRVEWTKYPEKRQSIELQAKVLKLAIQVEEDKQLEKDVERTLFKEKVDVNGYQVLAPLPLGV